MKLQKTIFILLFQLYLFASLGAQEKHNYQLGVNSGYGFIITHSPGMRYITAQHLEKFDAYFEKNTFGSAAWHQRYGFPQMGVSLTYFKLNNPSHLGNGFSLAPYLKFQLNKSQLFQLKLRTALGLGYLSQKFHPQENFKNNAIGSHLNLFFSVCLGLDIPINERLFFNISTNFSHFSNTSFSKPNLGINIASIEGGVAYNLGQKKDKKLIEEKAFIRKKGYWQITSSIGINEVDQTNRKKYIATALSFGREKRLNYKSTLGGAFDLFYNEAQRVALQRKEIEVKPGWENLQSGFSIYHVLHFGNFGVLTQAGYYFKTKDKELGNFYHIVGGRVKINRQLHGFFALKTHFARAEYLSIGINYHLKK